MGVVSLMRTQRQVFKASTETKVDRIIGPSLLMAVQPSLESYENRIPSLLLRLVPGIPFQEMAKLPSWMGTILLLLPPTGTCRRTREGTNCNKRSNHTGQKEKQSAWQSVSWVSSGYK